jgi:sarcosine oxidase
LGRSKNPIVYKCTSAPQRDGVTQEDNLLAHCPVFSPVWGRPEGQRGGILHPTVYDIAIVGLGGMGSAALASASRLGLRAVGLEQFGRLHELGASSGRSRMIRKAYFEDAAYVPLLLRAYEAWRELEAESGEKILYETGVVMVAAPNNTILEGAQRTAQAHGLAHEVLSREDVRSRFPMFTVREGEVALFEPDGGFVVPEAAVRAQLQVAEARGAEMRFNTRVTGWHESASGHLLVDLEDGSSLETARLAICSGPWIAPILRELGVPLTIQRNVQHWFEPLDGRFALAGCPSFFSDRADQPTRLYGFPDHGYGVKAAFHGYGEQATTDSLDREIHEYDIEPVRRALDNLLPGAAGRYLGGKACMYALTPDEHFVVTTHPNDERIAVAGGFSGHGFKFAPVIGEIVTGLLVDGGTPFDIDFISHKRFAKDAQ